MVDETPRFPYDILYVVGPTLSVGKTTLSVARSSSG